MRLFPIAIVAAGSFAFAAPPVPAPAGPAGGAAPYRAGGLRAPLRTSRSETACAASTLGQGAFLGVNNTNVAYGTESVVVGCLYDFACAGAASVLGGNGNATSAFGSSISGGTGNAITATGTYGFLGAGVDNAVSGEEAFVGSGLQNSATATDAVVVGGGYLVYNGTTKIGNTAGAPDAVVGGGSANRAGAAEDVIAGGAFNQIFTATSGSGDAYAAIGGGYRNSIGSAATTVAEFAVVAGGDSNAATGEDASIVGGGSNSAAGTYATVAGGEQNSAAGTASFAAGTKAQALNAGAFVWSDRSGTVLQSTANNQFLARASGGVKFYSNAAATAGVSLPAGSGTWSSLSDRTMKTAIVPLDDAAVLAKVAALPVSTWSYRSENGVRHVGPMAQDFYAAFHVGEDDRHITTIDEDGVALAAIKGLYVKSDRENRKLRAELSALRGEVARLAATVAARTGRQ